MLVLTRKVGQNLVIASDIVVTILEADGDRVKIGIEAPRDVSVLRGELYSETRYENWLAGAAGACADQILLPLLEKTQTPVA